MQDEHEESNELRKRTKSFAIEVIRFVENLPNGKMVDVLARQLLRCGTSVGANYRAACRAKSKPDFISKMGIVEEEADKAIYWLELLVESNAVSKNSVAKLLKEADEIVAMVVSSIKTARGALRFK